MNNLKFKDVYAVAIIPAKGNSTRLPKKNFQIINNKTLVEHAIDYAKSSKYIKGIYVSTDSNEIKEISSWTKEYLKKDSAILKYGIVPSQ